MMKVSVVVPVWNEENYIRKCLEGLSRQTTPPDEIIVVDNNCTDKSMSIAKNFGVKIIPEPQQGIVYSRDTGFNNCQHDIIARCDADTIVPPFWIERIILNFEKHPIDALGGSLVFYDLPLKSKVYSGIYFRTLNLIQGGESLVGSNMALSNNIWLKVRDQVCHDETKIHEDIDLALHILSVGGIIRQDPELIAKVSGRRIKYNPKSFFKEYPARTLRNILSHR